MLLTLLLQLSDYNGYYQRDPCCRKALDCTPGCVALGWNALLKSLVGNLGAM